MAAKRKRTSKHPSSGPNPGKSSNKRPAEESIGIRPVPGKPRVFELVYPRCVRQRKDDLEEVRAMLDAGEVDVAVDELRWLLDGCNVLLEAHTLLGEIALGDEDFLLARNHFGYAYEQGLEALGPHFSGQLPYARPANRVFHEAGKGLAWCLRELGKPSLAREIVAQLLALDPADPLGLEEMLQGP